MRSLIAAVVISGVIATQAAQDLPEGALRRIKGACALYQVSFSPDGTLFAAFREDDHKPALWDVASGREVRAGDIEARIFYQGLAVAFAPDGKSFVAGDSAAFRFETLTGKNLGRLAETGLHQQTAIAWSPDSRRVACAAGYQNAVVMYEVADLKASRLFSHTERVNGVAFAPGGKAIFTVGDDADLRKWDPATGSLTMPSEKLFTIREGRICGMAVSPDGRVVASTGEDGCLRFWDGATGRLLTTIEKSVVSRSMAFSPDGRLLAIAGGESVDVRDVASGSFTRRIKHECWLRWVAFTPDGGMVATPGKNWSTLLWSVEPEPWRERPTLDALLAKLDGDDPAESRRAVWALAGISESTAVLTKRLTERTLDEMRAKALIAALDDNDPERREKATKELPTLGVWVAPLLKKEKATATSEAASRLAGILEVLERPAGLTLDALKRARAMHVLERRRETAVLRTLAAEAPLERERWEAAEALRRIEGR